MTEEIIIDGVNVAGCKFIEETVRYNNKAVCSCTDVRDCEGDLFIECCGEKPNCYYKQLKRLEQERDELKFGNDRYKQLLKGCPAEDEDCGFCVVDEQNKRLKQENKELKEKIKKYSAINEQNTKDYAILRNVLEEIQKVIKSYDLTVDNGVSVDTLYTIRKIINEVINESN